MARAEREPENRRKLVLLAQDEFTKLIKLEQKPYLAARACHSVGVCHQLLENERYAKQYYADAARLVVTAFEQAEDNRCNFWNLSNFLGALEVNIAQAKRQSGLSFRAIDCGYARAR